MSMSKVSAGEQLHIEASTFNAMIDAAEAHKQQASGATGSGRNIERSADTIYVRNDSGTDVPRFGVLGLGAPIITPTNNLIEWQNNASLIGTTPTTPTHVGKFGIAIEPIAAGKIGRVKIDGPTPVKINITDATHTHADIATTDVTKLTSSTTGDAKILWQETGTGIKWCLVLLGQPAAVASAGTASFFLAAIAASPVKIASNRHRWRYSFYEIELMDSTADTWQAKAGGITGNAYNTIEYAHPIINAFLGLPTPANVWGVDIHAAGGAYPTGYSPMPITQNTIVQMRTTTAADLSSVYVFEAFGSHDGTC